MLGSEFILSSIKGGIIEHYVGEALTLIHKLLSPKKYRIMANIDDLTRSLNYHLTYINNFSSEISFRELGGSKSLASTFIELDIYLTPRRLTSNTPKQTTTINQIIKSSINNIIILGDPGAGKTTTIKNLCQKILFDDLPELQHFNFPILVELRNLKEEETIFYRLRQILGINIDFAGKSEDSLRSEIVDEYYKKAILEYLESVNCILLLDGLDELSPFKYRNIAKEINYIFLHTKKARTLLTCRSASFLVNLDNSKLFEICPLSKEQIDTFVNKWFTDTYKVQKFFEELNSTSFKDMAIRPLTIAHLCAIFDKYNRLPPKPKSIYKKLLFLLIEDWDAQRAFERNSKYVEFESDRKFDFLANFAYELTYNFTEKVYSEDQFELIYTKIHKNFNLPKSEASLVIQEIESHNGIIIKSAYDTFEFAHKSLQEYLCAEYLVKLPIFPKKLIYDRNIANEIAISVCLSSDHNRFLYSLVFEHFDSALVRTSFILEFYKRLHSEKPDFYSSPLLIVTFYYINHLFIEGRITDDIKSNKINFIEEFINIKKMFFKTAVLKKSQISLVGLYYLNDNNVEQSDKVNIEFFPEFFDELNETNEIEFTFKIKKGISVYKSMLS